MAVDKIYLRSFIFIVYFYLSTTKTFIYTVDNIALVS